jgi:hypothetical protein
LISESGKPCAAANDLIRARSASLNARRSSLRLGSIALSLPSQLSRFGGFAYEAPLPEFRRFEEYSGPNLVPSPILLYEDDKPLGPSVHDNLWSIARTGEGRFSHWNHTGMVFSATDNSDPRKNGRQYWAVLPRQSAD